MSDFTSILIAPFQTGLDTDQEPWIIPPDAFSELDNVHIRHGVIEKRSGFRKFAQLIPSADTVTITDITQAINGVVTTDAAHGYTTGDVVYILEVVGMTEVNDTLFTITVLTTTTFELNVDTSSFIAYVSDGTVQFVDPVVDRVMGLWRYIDDTNAKDLLGFNTTQANLYNGAANAFTELDAGTPIMNGGEFDYIWAVNWQSSDLPNRLYFTNGVAFNGASLNGIRFYDGDGTTTTDFNSNSLGGGRTLYGGKLLFVIKQRLVVLNTFENNGGTSNFPQRARWCQAQGPSNWDDLTAGGGGFVDAPTGEHIISGLALQDIIIVMFTNSVWTLRPVPDPALPFRWDKINDFRACDGKMATVGYDRDIRAVGVRGITATDGVETRRIDGRIQDFTIDEINFDFFEKVFCLRSYSNTRWWTLYPAMEDEENSKALIWDDDSSSFSTYTIAMNCLGYGNFGKDFTLADFTEANDLDLAINDFAEETLQSYFWQENQEALLGGDIHGTVFVLESGTTDNNEDISSRIFSAAWNPFKDQGIECRMNYIDFFIDTDQVTTGTVEFFKNNDTSAYITQNIDFLPNLDFIARIQNISMTNPVSVNAAGHGLSTSDIIFIYLVQGMVEVNGGPYTVTVTSENFFTLDGIDGTSFAAHTSGGHVVRRQFYKNKTWKRAYAGGIGYQHRIRLTSSGEDTPFRIHAFKPSFKAVGKRTIDR